MSRSQPTNFIYQQKNQNFPQFHQSITSPPNNHVGKILAKYRNKQIQRPNQNNITIPRKQSQHNNNKNHNLSVITGINYSQIYNDIKIDKQPYVSNNQLYRKQQNIQDNNTANNTNNHTHNNSEQKVNKLAYNFQSVQQMRNKSYQRMNKKMLPGIIMHSNKNNDVSFQSSQHQLSVDQAVNVGKYRNRQFRISDKNQRRPYFNQVSEGSVNMNEVNQHASQYQFDHLTHADISVNNIVYNKSGRSQLKNQDNQTSEMAISRQNNKHKQSKIEQKVLANSRSIGVGNYRIQKQDLYKQIDINEQINNSPNMHKKTPNAMPTPIVTPVSTPRYSKPNNQQNQKSIQQINYNTKANNIEQDINTHNPQYKRQKISEKKASSKKHSYQLLQSIHIQQTNINSNSNNKQKSKQISARQPQKQQQQQKEKSKSKQKIIHYDKQYIQSSSLRKSKQLLQVKQNNVNQHISIQVSRVASTIKPIANQQINQVNIHFQPFHDNQEDNHTNTYKNQPSHQHQHQQQNQHEHEQITGQISNNMIQILHSTSTKKQQLPQQHPHQNLNKQDYIPTFNIDQYSKIYTILKTIQTQLKQSILNVQQILKCIKTYLQIIAIGNLDNIDQFDLPLHKKKIIKNSLFLQRVAVIILAFSYTTHTIKQSLKYLQNMLGYSINNCLILIKILKQTQINQQYPHNNNNANILSNNVIQKSDRLVMKRNLDTLRNNNNVLLDAVQKLSKGQQIFYQNLTQIIKLISKASLEQTFYSLLEYFAFFLCVTGNDHMIPFLAVAPNPYLSPILKNSKYTLVIDVIELFCYSKKQSKTNIFRPYTQHFLHQMSQYYQLISFCPMFPSQIDKVIDMLDPKRYISSRLYKHHTINNNQNSLKYLDRIGRNMDQMILLDNENIGGLGSYQNCIHVPIWKGSKNDTVLAQLCPLLAMIALKRVPAQEAAKRIRQQLLKNKKEGVKYINFGISLD